MKLNEKTPQNLSCLVGACPAIFETENDTYVLIGTTLSNEQISKLLRGRVAPHETAIEIPKALLKDIHNST